MTRHFNHTEPSDNDLILYYQKTLDSEVLGQLYERYMHLVYGVCLKYLKEREWAKDSVIRIFEKLATDLPGSEIKNFKSWLYTITKNFCLMELRSRKSTLEREKKWVKDNVDFVDNSYQLHPIDDSTDQTLNDVLKKCIEKLKAEQRQCIELFYYDDKCYQEISDTLNMNVKAVKSNIQNGKRNLKICLEKNRVIQQQT